MANIKYSDLISEVLPILSADPSDPVTEHAIKRAVIILCNESRIWKHIPDAIDMVAGENAYDLEPPTGAEVACVTALSLEGVSLDAVSSDWLDKAMPDWHTAQSYPTCWTQTDTSQVILAKVPSANISGAIQTTLALQPTSSATGFPKWIATRHIHTIADGALGYLLMMPQKGWTDFALGSARNQAFKDGISEARLASVSGLSRARTRTTSQH